MDGEGEGAVGRENRMLRALVAAYRHLSGLAVQPTSPARILQLIADTTDTTAALITPGLEIMVAASPTASPATAAATIADYLAHPHHTHALQAATPTRRTLRLPQTAGGGPAVVAPVLVGDEVTALLLTLEADADGGQGRELALLLSEHAATMLGVLLGRERIIAAAASRARDDLVEGLLSGRGEPAEVQGWASHLGYDPGGDHHVLSVRLELAEASGGGGRGRLAQELERLLTAQAPEAITLVRDAEVVAIVPEPSAGGSAAALRLGQACLARAGELGGGVLVTVGVGGICRGPEQVARSYAEARRTIDMVRRLGRSGCVVAFETLDIHRLLLQVPDLGELRGFAMGVLGKLLAHEREHRSEYLATLAWYFRENSSPQRASRALGVHPNTVSYRVRRIEQLTGLDFGGYRDRLLAQVALEILDAVGDDL